MATPGSREGGHPTPAPLPRVSHLQEPQAMCEMAIARLDGRRTPLGPLQEQEHAICALPHQNAL